MAYKLYLTVELPESYDDKDAAMDAAVKTLQDAVESFHQTTDHTLLGVPVRPIEARVFEDGKITSGEPHDFIVDIHDGAI